MFLPDSKMLMLELNIHYGNFTFVSYEYLLNIIDVL